MASPADPTAPEAAEPAPPTGGPPVPPSPQRSRLLWWLLGGIVALALLGAGTLTVVVWQLGKQDRSIPDGWSTARFAMDAATNDKARKDLGLVLTDRLARYGAPGATFSVRDQAVTVAVSPGKGGALDRLRNEMPLRVAMSIRPVMDQQPVPNGDCKATDGAFCARDGKTLYKVSDPLVGGTGVRDAVADHDPNTGHWQVTVSFTSQGQEAFTTATRENKGRQLAVMVVDTIVTAPQVDAVITGDAVISGALTRSEAEAIAAAIRLSRSPGDVRLAS